MVEIEDNFWAGHMTVSFYSPQSKYEIIEVTSQTIALCGNADSGT